MDMSRFFLIACGVTVLGIALPAAIFFMARRENTAAFTNIFRQVGTTARQPWKSSEADLDELSRRVAALRRDEPGPTKDTIDGTN